MKLIKYIEKHEKSLNSFAKRADMLQPTVYRIAMNQVQASGASAIKIVAACDGKVSFHDLYPMQECITS